MILKIFTSCRDAIDACIETQSFALAHLYSDEKPMNMHIHDSYELYFSISGGRQFLIDNRFYTIQPGDLFFINQYESHHLTQIDSQIHERIVFSIYPDYLKALSSPETDLDFCFSYRAENPGHRISLSDEEQKRFLYYVHKLSSIQGYGADLLEKAVFLELMVYLNQCFSYYAGQTISPEKTEGYHAQVDEILAYIHQNIGQTLTIDTLAGHFFLSPSYLCRIFKSTTGTTINKYITAKRIALAKSLLMEGHTVNETAELCGFNDYSNFLKAFTKAVGISPKKYAGFTGLR